MHLRGNDYFRRRLADFFISLSPDKSLLQPKIIAIRPKCKVYGLIYKWSSEAKRVGKGDEKRIMDNITKLVPWDSQDWQKQVMDLEYSLEYLVESILDNGEEFEDISDYLFIELGLGESWPIALRKELRHCGYTYKTTKEQEEWKKTLPGGSTIPVKFLHQLDTKERPRESPIEEVD